jgi:hypothetical protein
MAISEVDWMGGERVSLADILEITENKVPKIELAPTTQKAKVEIKNYVHEPSHYQIFPDTQVIDVIKKALTKEEFIGFCKGNILKYRLRDKQDRNEDYEKSKKYQMYLQDIENI